MPDRKPQVLRYVKFTVADRGENDYGDLKVHSTSGKEYKISKKRANLFDMFQPEAEVIVGWASYMNRDYIAVAHPADQFPEDTTVEEEKLTSPKLPTPAPQQGKIKPEVTPKLSVAFNEWDRQRSIQRQTALNCAVEFAKILMAVKPDIKSEQIVAMARVFEAYLEGKSKLVREAKKLGAVET